jgi:hypothetical protein
MQKTLLPARIPVHLLRAWLSAMLVLPDRGSQDGSSPEQLVDRPIFKPFIICHSPVGAVRCACRLLKKYLFGAQTVRWTTTMGDNQTLTLHSSTDDAGNPSITSVLSYEHPWLKDSLVKTGLSEADAECLLKDVLRFLYVSGTYPREHLCPPPQIDVGWKEFLSFTEDYHDFCQRFFGRYIHRRPTQTEYIVELNCVRRTRELVKRAFGTRLSENWNWN